MASRRTVKYGQRGMSLVEVALAILVGTIVAVAALNAFNFAMRSAIRTRQQRNVAMFRSLVEQIKAGHVSINVADFYKLTMAQMKSFVDSDTGRIPSMGRNPYTALKREACDLTAGSCTGTVYATFGPVGSDTDPDNPITNVSQIQDLPKTSDLIYLYGATAHTKFIVTSVDLITKTYAGYMVLESDSDGNIVAAAGGGNGDE